MQVLQSIPSTAPIDLTRPARPVVHVTHNAAIQAAMAQAIIFKMGEAPLCATAGLQTGFSLLDAQLSGGGWPRGSLIEIMCDAQGCGEVSLLLPALMPVALNNNEDASKSKLKKRKNSTNDVLKTPCLWVSPPYLPYAPGLLQAGLDMQALTIIDVARAEDALWAAEQALASGAYGRVCLWVKAAIADTSLRRLHYAASVGGTYCWLLRPLHAANQPSPAPLRITLQALADGTLRVRLLKVRGMKPGKTIVLATRHLACLHRDEVDGVGFNAQHHLKAQAELNHLFAKTTLVSSAAIGAITAMSKISTMTTPDLTVRQRALAPDR